MANKKSTSIVTGRSTVSVWLVEDNHNFRNTIARALGRIEGL